MDIKYNIVFNSYNYYHTIDYIIRKIVIIKLIVIIIVVAIRTTITIVVS